MKKFFWFFLILSACSFARNNPINCNSFDVNIQNKLFHKPLFFANLKREIIYKLNPLRNENSSNVCVIDVSINNVSYDSLTNAVGTTSRTNVNTRVNFSFKIGDKDVLKNSSISVFYGKNEEGSRYSNYKNEEKTEEELAKNIANEIYKEIVVNL